MHPTAHGVMWTTKACFVFLLSWLLVEADVEPIAVSAPSDGISTSTSTSTISSTSSTTGASVGRHTRSRWHQQQQAAAEQHISLPFDCDVAYNNWRKAWSKAKMQFCCEKAGRACAKAILDSTSLHFDCDAAYNNWRKAWSEAKMKWCCAHERRGCEETASLPFDCDAAYNNWRKAWSEAKMKWCCAHERRGCEETASLPFDCDAAYNNWRKAWSKAKMKWCCAHEHRGCSPLAFDCQAGLAKWETGWSAAKKKWCCNHEQRGCDAFDCDEGFTDWRIAWTSKKQLWCCKNHGLGCSTTTSLPFDCSAGFAKWETGWSVAKKKWCCSHEQRGCDAFDCDEGFADWRLAWTSKKKLWCCKNHGLGCSTTTSLPFDCDAAYNNWHKAWSTAKMKWCCEHFDRGCPRTTTSVPFDCDAGFSKWEAGWSTAKKKWCCAHENRGCDAYDCDEGLSHWETAWPGQKKTWCCKQHGLGCTTTTTSLPFDCSAGFTKWETGWSVAKKKWCCNHEQRGCDAFDCDEGFADWRLAWTSKKKLWCCEKHGLACTTTTDLPFDCDAAYNNWQKAWSSAKMLWCCEKFGRGCTTTSTSAPFDCDAGFSKWATGWSEAKKTWCCAHEHRGCFTTTTLPFDCDAAFNNWRKAWSIAKKNWCCEKVGRGCTTTTTTEQFDCEADVEDWRNVWPVAKASWCCEKNGTGCITPKPWYQSWSSSIKDWCCNKTGVGCGESSATSSDNKSLGPLLVQYYEPCMLNSKKKLSKYGLSRGGGKCPLARKCFKELSLAESACKVVYLPTIDISELKGYVCGQSLCIQRVREIGEQCSFFPSMKTRFSAIYHFNKRYCPADGSPTDLINDYTTCMSIKGENTTKCGRAKLCYDKVSVARSSCHLNDGDAGPSKSGVCNSRCQDYVSQALSACTPYQPVMKSMLSVVWHQSFYSCASGSNAKQIEMISSSANMTTFNANVADHNRLTEEYKACLTTENSSNRAECERAKRCYHYLSVAETSCNVVSLPTTGVSEVKPYICGNSTCGTYARSIKAECTDYPSVMAAMDPILHYQLQYCPDGWQKTDMINDHSLCRSHLKTKPWGFCAGVRQCYKHMMGVIMDCALDGTTVAEVQASVCSAACRSHVRALETTCSAYAMANESRSAVALYERVLGCSPPNASKLFLQPAGALTFSFGLAGSFLLVGAVTASLVGVLIMLRGVSRLGLRGWSARDPYSGYELIHLQEQVDLLRIADEHSS